MAKKAKGNRIQVILECTEHKTTGVAGTSRYITLTSDSKVSSACRALRFRRTLFCYLLSTRSSIRANMKSDEDLQRSGPWQPIAMRYASTIHMPKSELLTRRHHRTVLSLVSNMIEDCRNRFDCVDLSCHKPSSMCG